MPIVIIGGISMNWRKLIYSIIIPSVASFIFGIFLSIGVITNAIVFFYAIVMMIAALLSSTGKGKNGDALSTIFMGVMVAGVTWLLISLLGEMGERFSWLFVLKTAGFMLATSFTVWLAKFIMEDKKQN